jgi:integrase
MKGHVRRRGNSWELRAYVGVDPTTGRAKYLTRTFRGGKREADEALARFVTEVSGSGHAAKDTTLSELIRRWLDLVREDLSPSTVRGYERIIRCYIEPDIGRVSLAKLRTDQLDRFYSKLRDGGGKDGGTLSPATVRQTHAVIRRALNQAMRWGWIAANPASLARPPRVRTQALHPPEPDGVLRLIAEAERADPDLACFLLLAATTGARRGELCALRWSDLDKKTGALTISRSIVETQGSTLIEKDTKMHSSRRIALDSGSIAAMADQRDRCQRRAKSCGARLPRLCSHLLRRSRRRSALGAERSDEAVHPDTAIGRPGFSPSARSSALHCDPTAFGRCTGADRERAPGSRECSDNPLVSTRTSSRNLIETLQRRSARY